MFWLWHLFGLQAHCLYVLCACECIGRTVSVPYTVCVRTRLTRRLISIWTTPYPVYFPIFHIHKHSLSLSLSILRTVIVLLVDSEASSPVRGNIASWIVCTHICTWCVSVWACACHVFVAINMLRLCWYRYTHCAQPSHGAMQTSEGTSSNIYSEIHYSE